MPKASLIVPTYEEASNLPRLIKEFHTVLANEDFEIIIVDDDSADGTAEVAEKLSEIYGNITVIRRQRKMGIGSAIKDGFKFSTGDVIIQMDADFSHSPYDLPKLLNAINHADIVLGSRRVEGGRTVGWSFYRNMIHMGANILSKIILGLDVKDVTSGFKAYRREVFKKLTSRSSFNAFADFDQECLYFAKKLGLRVVEVPITFVNRNEGESKLGLRDVLSFIKAVFRLKFGKSNMSCPDHRNNREKFNLYSEAI